MNTRELWEYQKTQKRNLQVLPLTDRQKENYKVRKTEQQMITEWSFEVVAPFLSKAPLIPDYDILEESQRQALSAEE